MDVGESDNEVEDRRIQVPKVHSTNPFSSGSRETMPTPSSTRFVYVLKTEDDETIMLENTGTFKLSEYNFGKLFDDFDVVTLEMSLGFHYMFDYMLDVNWPNVDFEYTVNVYTERRIALYDLENIDYWPCVLAWCAFQCISNGVNFFDHVRLVGEDHSLPYGTVFA